MGELNLGYLYIYIDSFSRFLHGFAEDEFWWLENKYGQVNLGKIIPQSAMPSMDKTPDMLHFPGIASGNLTLPYNVRPPSYI